MGTDKKKLTSKKATVTLIIVSIAILIGIITKSSYFDGKVHQLAIQKTIVSIEPLKGEQVYINAGQIVKITKDGITAYNLEGEELWKDTLNFENLWIMQRDPYLAITSKQGNDIIIFNDKGRQGEIKLKNLVVYFSVNEKGSIVTVESLEDGHSISTYDIKGNALGVQRVSYIEQGGYPITAEISPDNEVLIISYINVTGPSISSSLVALQIDKPQEEKRDNVWYGLEQKGNLVYEIEFLNNKEWVSIGDNILTFYNLQGEVISQKENLYATYIPYITKKATIGQLLSIVATDKMTDNSVHNKEKLYMFDAKGESNLEEEFEKPITYFRSDDKGVIIGQDREFTGFNKMGMAYFKFKATQDIKSLVYFDHKAVAVGKNEVLLLKSVDREEQ